MKRQRINAACAVGRSAMRISVYRGIEKILGQLLDKSGKDAHHLGLARAGEGYPCPVHVARVSEITI